MPPDTPYARDPVYLSYIYNHLSPTADPPSIGRPYQPSSQLSRTELDLEGARGVYEHFHTPWNQHNRFLVAVPDTDKYAYRDLERRAPHPFDKTSGWGGCGRGGVVRGRSQGQGACPCVVCVCGGGVPGMRGPMTGALGGVG